MEGHPIKCTVSGRVSDIIGSEDYHIKGEHVLCTRAFSTNVALLFSVVLVTALGAATVRSNVTPHPWRLSPGDDGSRGPESRHGRGDGP